MKEANQLNMKSVAENQNLTIQERTRRPPQEQYGAGLLYWLVRGGEAIAPWWAPARDVNLRTFWKKSDHLAGAIYTLQARLTTVPVHVEPRDVTRKRYIKQAEEYTKRIVEESAFNHGWINCFGKWLQDMWTTDNGAFLEIIGEGNPNGPITGPALGLANLDSNRCTRTSNPEFPVIYMDTDSKRYQLHHTRVAFASLMPSPIAEMNGVGYCNISRAVNTAQNLIDIGRYKQEKMGSRPLRAILTAKGISTDAVQSALQLAALAMDSQGLSRYSRMPLLGDIPVEAGIELVDLVSLPDGFNEEESTRLGMFAVAMAFGVPIRWLWPAAVVGATKADAMYQHIAGLGGGAGQALRLMATLLGGSERGTSHMTGKFLPPHLKLVFDFQDDEQDRMRAEIRDIRSVRHERDIASGALTTRVVREQMLTDGDITRTQFVELELADGRLEDGGDVLNLFFSSDAKMRNLLDIGVDNVILAIEDSSGESLLPIIDEKIGVVRENLLGGGDASVPKQALAALLHLKTLIIDSSRQRVEPVISKPDNDGSDGNNDDDAEDIEKEPIDNEIADNEPADDKKDFEPRGRPLSRFTLRTVKVRQSDIKGAVEQWRDTMPSEYSSILEAES